MIVRNGAATLAACLRSIVPLCDELIVVDTGSDDDSSAIARSFGARVVHEPWRDDFSAARNVYLQHARCRWVLSLDADEVFGDVDRDAFTSALHQHPNTAFLFRIRNYVADGDIPQPTLPSKRSRGYLVSKTVRLFPRLPEMRYCYPVHESLFPAIRRAGIRVQPCAIPIQHIGYVHARKKSRAKIDLYRSLGEKKIAEFPDYGLGYMELGKVYLHEQEFADARRMFVHAIRLAPRCVEAYYFLALTLLRQERYAECGRVVHAARGRFPLDADIRQMAGLLRRQMRHSGSASAVM